MAEKIRVKHITNSLYQMEKWCRYLRVVLNKMDQNTLVSAADTIDLELGDDGGVFKRPVLAMGCPPPPQEHDPDCSCPDCCDDEKHHGKGKHKGNGKGKGKGKGKAKK